jgi:hypothetical protein
MDAEHAQYLDQVCDGNGTLAYIPPPPPTPRPAPSLPVVTSIEPHHGPVFGRTVITITGLFFGLLPHEQEVTLGGKELCATMVWVSQSVIRCTTKPVESPVGKGFEHLLVEVTRKQGGKVFKSLSNGTDIEFSYVSSVVGEGRGLVSGGRGGRGDGGRGDWAGSRNAVV